MTDALVDLPAEPGQRVDQIHCWIAHHANGAEGIVSLDMETAFGPRHMPAMSSRRQIAEMLEPRILRAVRQTMHPPG